MGNRIKDIKILSNESILFALKQMDLLGLKSLIIINEQNIFIGVLSIGDIQRAIIKNARLDSPVSSILRVNTKFAKPDQSIVEIKEQMLRYRMEFMPVVSDSGKLTRIYFWEELFLGSEVIPYPQFSVPVVIMAGGEGIRLRPLTNVFPKPLMPFKNHTIIEEIMVRFACHGCRDFYISINYKSEIIQFYLNKLDLGYKINFLKETMPLGTGGSLSMLKGRINNTFIVTNCDIIIDQDYSEILNYHYENKNLITIVAALKHYPIPYGVLESGEFGDLLNLQEKPELTFKINSGMYILESEVLDEIQEDTFMHITQLIGKLQNSRARIGVFPVSEKSWKDIGNWEDYFNNIE